MLRPAFEVHIGGEVWRTDNWSLGGVLLVRPYDGPLELADPVSGSICGPSAQGFEAVPFTARVLRRSRRNRSLALRFDPLDTPLLNFLERCLRQGRPPA